MIDDLYQEVILEEYAHPRNKGKLPTFDAQLLERNSSCGDEVEVFIKFEENGEVISQIGWEGVGCAISMASASFLSEQVKGMSRKQVSQLTKSNVEEMLGVHDISPGREKCLLLALKALQKAVHKESLKQPQES